MSPPRAPFIADLLSSTLKDLGARDIQAMSLDLARATVGAWRSGIERPARMTASGW
jgi:hypothetical protein